MRKDLKKTRRAAYAAGTRKNHRTQWKAYLSFCLYFDLPYLPASLDTVCLYCQFLSCSMTPQSVRNYLSVVKLLHIVTGFDFPFYETFELCLTLCGLDHMHRHLPSCAPPVTPDLLCALMQCRGSQFDFIFNCTFLFTFFLFARISNLVPVLARSFDPTKHLCCRDIKITSFGLSVSFKLSKTNQTGTKVLTLPLLSNSDHLLCPVQAYLKMCTFLPAPVSAPAFFTLEGHFGHYTIITKSQFMSVFRSHLQRLGVSDSSKFRGHSFHRGGATWAFRSGVPGELIQVYGDWASDAYKVYLEFSEDAKLCIARRMISMVAQRYHSKVCTILRRKNKK